MAYTYRFVDVEGKIIYVGYTGQTLDKRLSQHFEKGHLDKSCYKAIARIEYIQYKTKADAQIMEVYFINKYKPKYNKLNKQTDTMSLQLEEGKWKLYKEYKKQNEPLQLENLWLIKLGMVGLFIYMLLKMIGLI